jgi:hypothetical protein
MSVKLISYDLGVPETSQSYQDLIAYIKSLGDWCKPLYSYFLVDTNKHCSTIRDEAKAYLDTNDKFLVINSPVGNWASYNLSKTVTDWLNSH